MKRLVIALSAAMMMLLSLFGAGQLCAAQPDVYGPVEVRPKYKGGDAALIKYLSENIVYPPEAVAQGIEGRVVVKFVVGVDGQARSAEVVRSVHPLLDAEAVRVASTLTEFTPGMVNGKNVAVSYVLPISFKLPAPEKAPKK